MYSSIETALRAALGETVADARARAGRAVGGVQPHRRRQPRRVAPRPGGARVPRAPVGQEPDARGAVHASGTARSGTSTRPPAFVLCSAEAADRAGVAAGPAGVPARGRRVEHMVRGVEARRAPPRRRPCASAPSSIAELTGIDVPRATSSTSTAASRRGAGPGRGAGPPIDDPEAGRSRVSGGMTFAGGPLDNDTFQALARMVDAARAAGHHRAAHVHQRDHHQARHVGVVDDARPHDGFRFADVSDEAAVGTDGARGGARPRRRRAHRRVHGRAPRPASPSAPSSSRPPLTAAASSPQPRHRPRRRDGRRRVVRPRRPRDREHVPLTNRRQLVGLYPVC